MVVEVVQGEEGNKQRRRGEATSETKQKQSAKQLKGGEIKVLPYRVGMHTRPLHATLPLRTRRIRRGANGTRLSGRPNIPVHHPSPHSPQFSRPSKDDGQHYCSVQTLQLNAAQRPSSRLRIASVRVMSLWLQDCAALKSEVLCSTEIFNSKTAVMAAALLHEEMVS